jgi:hypothetical protein
MDQSLFAAPHGLSQRTTSFIASQRQGIHQMPFFHLIALITHARPVPQSKWYRPEEHPLLSRNILPIQGPYLKQGPADTDHDPFHGSPHPSPYSYGSILGLASHGPKTIQITRDMPPTPLRSSGADPVPLRTRSDMNDASALAGRVLHAIRHVFSSR